MVYRLRGNAVDYVMGITLGIIQTIFAVTAIMTVSLLGVSVVLWSINELLDEIHNFTDKF